MPKESKKSDDLVKKASESSATLSDIEDAFKGSARIGDYRSAVHWVKEFGKEMKR